MIALNLLSLGRGGNRLVGTFFVFSTKIFKNLSLCFIRRRWEESDTCGGECGQWRYVACLHVGPPGEAQQVREILVLVLLDTGGGGAGLDWRQGGCGSSLG